MPPSAMRSRSKKVRKIGKKGARFVGESAFAAASRRARNTRSATAMSKRRGTSSAKTKSRKSRAPRKVKVSAASRNNMNINAMLRRSARSRKAVHRYDPSANASAGPKSKSAKAKKSTKASSKFQPMTTVAENWGGEDANDELNALANKMGGINFGLGHSKPAPPATKWPPSGRG